MPRKYLLLLALAASIVLGDQWTKYLAVSHLTRAFPANQRNTVAERVTGFFTLKNLDNDPYDPAKADLRVSPYVVSQSFWSMRYVENPGAAWGLLSGVSPSLRVPFFHVVSIVAIAAIILFFRRLKPSQRLLSLALSFVLGGAIGNYIDRLARNYVIDFVDWHWKDGPPFDLHFFLVPRHWPTFNVADSAICVGVVLMLIESFLHQPAHGTASQAAPTEDASRQASR